MFPTGHKQYRKLFELLSMMRCPSQRLYLIFLYRWCLERQQRKRRNGNHYGWESGSGDGSGDGSESDQKAGFGNGVGNTNNTDCRQNQSGILFQEEGGVSELELIGLIKTEGHQKNYELIEYVNRENG